MYSIIPAIVALLFLAFGSYVIHAKGVNRVSTAFLILCVATFFWQMAWAVLFQVEDEELAIGLIKIGWIAILLLPTSLYHFLVETTKKHQDLRFVYASYSISAVLIIILINSHYIIDGHYSYFFGYYPKAGILHPLHIIQTAIVVLRGLYITYQKQQTAVSHKKVVLQYYIASLFIYFFAAIDYICNYGIEWYPPGVLFIALSLGIITVVTIKDNAINSTKIISSSIAHEMRTPLATIQAQAEIICDYLPILINHYQQNPPKEQKISSTSLHGLTSIPQNIQAEITNTHQNLNMLLAFNSYEHINKKEFTHFCVQGCIEHAIARFKGKKNITLHCKSDFMVHASQEFLILIIINLIKNAEDAIKTKASGDITIDIYTETPKIGFIDITDSGCGIQPENLPYIFNKFFTTKKRHANSGVGLSFCKTVMEAFGGKITCESILAKHTTFKLHFNVL